jgi:hypothetical protein
VCASDEDPIPTSIKPWKLTCRTPSPRGAIVHHRSAVLATNEVAPVKAVLQVLLFSN